MLCLSVSEMEVSNASLHSDLDEEIFMSLPLGYAPGPNETLPPNSVCDSINLSWIEANFLSMVQVFFCCSSQGWI